MALCSVALALGGCGERGSSGERGGNLAKVERAALEEYRWQLVREAAALVEVTGQVRGQIVTGDVGKAQSRYAMARVHYGHLLPAALLSPALDRSINGRLAGFHRVERGIFGREETRGLGKTGKRLVDDARRMHHAVKTMIFEPGRLARATRHLAADIYNAKATGREEPYSHIDMVDVAASLEGAEHAFEALRPRLASENLELVEALEAQFVVAYQELGETGTPAREPQTREPAAGARFIVFDDLQAETINAIRRALHPLVSLFAEAGAAIAAR